MQSTEPSSPSPKIIAFQLTELPHYSGHIKHNRVNLWTRRFKSKFLWRSEAVNDNFIQEAVYVLRNIQARSCNRFCKRKAKVLFILSVHL